MYSSTSFWNGDVRSFWSLEGAKYLIKIQMEIGIHIQSCINSFNNEFNFELTRYKTNTMTSLKYSPQSQSNPESSFTRFQDTYFLKQLLKRLQKYKDNQEISLEQSIPVLYDLNIFQQLTSIPEAKRRLTQEGKPNNRLQLEARFIYNLWKLIGQQFILMRDFKKLVTIFITQETSQLLIRLQKMFEDQDGLVIEILAIWEAMLQNKSHHSSYQEYRESQVLTEQGNFNTSNDFYKHSKKSSSKFSPHNYSTNSMQPNRINLNNTEKQNQQKSVSKFQTQNQSQRIGIKTRRENIEEVKNQIYNSNLYEIPVLTVQKQKELVNRLYVVNKYERYKEIKKIQDQQKLQKQLQQCTFRPNVDKAKPKRPDTAGKNRTSRTQSKPIPGFEKAIERMKVGQQKSKELKQKLQLRNISLKQGKDQGPKNIIPPKFLNREKKKDDKKVLFTIQFDIGRHKLTCKIHENESAEHLAKNIQSIYSLKEDSFEQIKGIIEQEMVRYSQINQQEQQNLDQNKDMSQNQDGKKIDEKNYEQNNFVYL